MQVIGIVAEYNPFHTGHAYQILSSRQLVGRETAVVAVMSGNWVQQADCAIADKWVRTKLALLGGVDLVLELPTVWATASAERFAKGAISLMNASGIIDFLSFGSECGDIGQISQIAHCLNSSSYEDLIGALSAAGKPFAACRQEAVERILGQELASILSSPNNNLGIEYLRALDALNSSISPITIIRQGAAHNSVVSVPTQFVSATQLRMHLRQEQWEQAKPYFPADGYNTLIDSTSDLPSLSRVERAVLAKLRTMTADDWAKLPDSGFSEGLTKRLERAGHQCSGIHDFLESVKSKRFTHARLRRLLLWAYLGIESSLIPSAPLYIRVLGFNQKGRDLLKKMKHTSQLPVITKPAHTGQLSSESRELFSLECQCTNLYDLCFDAVPVPGREWRTSPVIL